ncbi:MAG: ABC transporter ATP-binding protein [Clostridiales bacterium]|nr:ABC transporter ATP-binding protein [Clostridiales bacterium]
MFQLTRYLKYYRKQVIIGPMFKWLEAMFELIVPLVMAQIIDVGIKNRDKNYVLIMGGVMVLLGLLGLCFAIICQYSASVASQGIGTIMRNDLFYHINTLSHKELDTIGTNSLITRITNDVNQMQFAVAMLIRLVVRAPFLVIGATAMAMVLDLKLSLIFIIIAPLVAFVLYMVMNKSVPFYRVRQKKLDRISLITRESLTGIRVIRAFSKQKKEEERFEQASDDLTDVMVSVGKISAFLNPVLLVIMNLAIIAILWFGGERVYIGALTQGEIIAFVNYMTQISLALVVVANLVVVFTKASASAARINEIFDLEPSIKEETRKVSKSNKETAAKISFDQVFFSYDNNNEYELEDINVDIYPNETIGIIGGTGAGKSTFIHLISRFYDVSKGEIRIDGIPIKEYSFKDLRGQIGLVQQRAVLFHGSIKKNLQLGEESITADEMEKALRVSQSKEFVDGLSKGIDSMVSQDGQNLSGGQRQRLTIARALAMNPQILILDDSASALDYATEAKLRKALKSECQEMTVIIVSQRANSIKHADKILVLDDGKLIGTGTHEELLESCQVYKEICLSQFKDEEVYA